MTKFGACDVVRCLAPTGGPGPAEVRASAGAITVRGGLLPSAGLMFTDVGSKGSYSTRSGALGRLFAGGEKFTINAAGAPNDVSAFAADITAPSELVGAGIAPDLRLGVNIANTQDFTVTWNKGGSGDARLNASFVVAEPITIGVQINCTVPQAAGSVTMPKAAFANIPANASGSVFLTPTVTKFQHVGDYRVRLTASGEVVSGQMTVRR